jgi:peptidylprolyl isomerase domain and WD repeat-containing protein 1
VVCSSRNEYIITFSIDGHIKFWRKVYHLVEFVKHFKAHNGLITSISLSRTHDKMCTVSVDRTLKIFDVLNCDLMTVVRLPFSPFACEFIPQANSDSLLVAVSEDKSGRIMIINPDSEVVSKQEEEVEVINETNTANK